MLSDHVELTSLCQVSQDATGQTWLMRLADVRNGQLVAPILYETLPAIFENRERIFRNDGPSENGDIGVWDWSAIPNRQNPDSDYIQSSYCPNLSPVRIFPLANVSTDEQLINALSDGFQGFWYNCDTIFVYSFRADGYRGVFCKREQVKSVNGSIKLKENIFSLPIYEISASEVHFVKKHLRFLKSLHIDPPKHYIPLVNANEVVRTLLLERLTWPAYRNHLNGTKAAWRDCKAMLDYLTSETLYEAVAKSLNCSSKQAETVVKDFIEHVNSLLDQGDIDSEILGQIILRHDGLRAHCEEIAAAQWKKEHQLEVAAAQTELEQIHQRASSTEQEIQKQLQEAETKKSLIEQEKSAAQAELDHAKEQLESALNDIHQCEAIGASTLQATRNKIGEARKDVSDFLAELSIFMPQENVASPINNAPTSASTLPISNTWHFTLGQILDEPLTTHVEDADWSETLDTLKENLRRAGLQNGKANGDSTAKVNLLSAFLYAAYINHINLLLVGPNAESIANALSFAVTGRSSSVLDCSGSKDAIAVSSANADTDSILTIRNPFHPDWLSCMSTMRTSAQDGPHMMLWVHPFVEDLAIEPKSLYNYVLPVFTDCFVEGGPSCEDPMLAGFSTNAYKAFVPADKINAKSTFIKKLGMSKLVLNRLQRVLSDAKKIANSANSDMEYLFAYLPLATALSQADMLKDELESDKNISSTVRNELLRYLGDE